RDHLLHQLLAPAAEHPRRSVDHLPGRQPRFAVPVPGAVRPACVDVPVRVGASANSFRNPRTKPGDTIMSSLSGKTALVTGASRGMGRASALALARAGAQVLIHYSNSEKEADAVVAEIRKGGGRAEKVGADLRQADGPHILAKRVRAIVGDRLDILAANAGISKTASIEDTQIEDFDNLFAVNVRAPFFLVQQLLPA